MTTDTTIVWDAAVTVNNREKSLSISFAENWGVYGLCHRKNPFLGRPRFLKMQYNRYPRKREKEEKENTTSTLTFFQHNKILNRCCTTEKWYTSDHWVVPTCGCWFIWACDKPPRTIGHGHVQMVLANVGLNILPSYKKPFQTIDSQCTMPSSWPQRRSNLAIASNQSAKNWKQYDNYRGYERDSLMTTVSVSARPEQSSTHLRIDTSVYDNVQSTIRVSRHGLIKQYACCHSIKHRNL